MSEKKNDKKDPLDRDVSLEVSVSEDSAKAAFSSRAVAAVDRLVGNFVDIPNPILEAGTNWLRRLNESAEKRHDIRIGLLEAAAEVTKQRNRQSDHPAVDSVIAATLGNEFRKQENVEAIVAETIPLLEEASAQSTEESADASNEMNPDWLNSFQGHAENASSEELRKTWARILAGEIVQPGSFGLATLRTISELSRDDALLFENILRFRLSEKAIVRPTEMEDQILLDFHRLDELGLVQNTELGSAILTKGLLLRPARINSYYSDLGLRCFQKSADQLKSIPIIFLTRVGREIASIVADVDGTGAIEWLADHYRSSCTKLEVFKIISRHADGSHRVEIIRDLTEVPTEKTSRN